SRDWSSDVCSSDLVGIFAGDGGGEDALGQAGAVVVAELVGGDDLAARVAGDVRHQALDLGDAALLEPAPQRAFLLLGAGLATCGSCTHASSTTGPATAPRAAMRRRVHQPHGPGTG